MKMTKHKNYKLKNVIRETELSSIIASPNSIYERNLKKEIKNKDIFCIKANKIKLNFIITINNFNQEPVYNNLLFSLFFLFI